MTPTKEQRREAVYQIQFALQQMNQNQPNRPRVAADGIYGPETTLAVRDFQVRNGLPVTGEVDYATWQMIFTEYGKHVARYGNPAPIIPNFSQPIPVGVPDVRIGLAQVMLWDLSNQYHNFSPIPITLQMDEPTIQGLHRIQNTNGLEQGDILDKMTWDALVQLHHANR